MAKISVIVPVYKVENYLPKLIESVLTQTLNDLELILVDDGSPDNSGKICDEYAWKDTRVKVIHKENGGVSAARNDGLAAASGDWVIFCDSDDWLEPGGLGELVVAGEESGADVVFGDVNLIKDTDTQLAEFYREPFVISEREMIDKLIAADFCRTYCFDPPDGGPAFGYGGPWNKIVRRKLLIDNQILFDLRVRGIFDDIIYTAYIFAAAMKIQYVHTVVYNYRQLDDSITHQYKCNLLQINGEIFTAWGEFVERYGSKGQFEKPYYANVMRRFRSLFDFYFFHPQNTTTLRCQFATLKTVLLSEPYRTAIRKAEYSKLSDRTTKVLWIIARLSSPRLLYVAMWLYKAIKS